ncbi:hypothetical protein FQN53_002634 [Emmonsiellopsis sp. PD_33]|nr:hypothetical protein FQN53_002634 [Emmonsiellopsis sp. PD_33]
MPSSEAMPGKAPARPKVSLIAWDPESPAHTERMFQQRLACGWKEDCIEDWMVLQREGKMALQWVVLSEDDPERESRLDMHLLKYPGEAAPILDTARAIGGKPRIPTLQSFIPVGHVSLDSEHATPGQADASMGIYCITALYISRALQGGGIGRATMDTIESEAIKEPLCAKILSLDTLSNGSPNIKEMCAESGMELPTISNHDWYERRGYKVWKHSEGDIQHRDPNGKVWQLDRVFMKKTVA